ncbi:adenosylmethionine-8-amino-7-oxononanoate aminotransferase [Patellaria atrata CBS 101060]|uniref:Adenosylmethionine-8-amino-7-oxononanoate aminotransferase n=1 Tax=Patellaria atrata CBS 101060 TaxID=1346257 RepID=A0A9P4SIT0_9PEZI|nr:adenosylmethionine-8-amino-7-oxononanoate aminotransferase [Patellaria atrata CBS 101060]
MSPLVLSDYSTDEDGEQTFTTPSSFSSSSSFSSGSAVLHRSLKVDPLKVIAASGINLQLSNGQEILDATGGAAVSCLGHGSQRVQKAIMAQMDIGVSYCHSMFFSTTASEGLAEELIASTNGQMAKAFIVGSGSESMEAALKLSRQYYLELKPPQLKRDKFISRHESYHGITLGALAAGGHKARRGPFEPLLAKITSQVSACNSYRGMKDGETEGQYVERLRAELDAEFVRVDPKTVCAFIAEPVVGAALGCVTSPPGYFKAMKSVCEKYGALLIFDEVMCGMGRTGTIHAWQQEGVVPDIQTIGKGLGGGYAPIAGLLINHRVVDVLRTGTGSFAHGQTYQGHPVSCAAALEVQRIIREEDLMNNVKKMGQKLEKLLRDQLGEHPNVGDIRGRGLFWGIEFVQEKALRQPFDPKEQIAWRIQEKGLQPPYSISLYSGTGTADGKSGDHILLAPAYNVTASEIEIIVDRTKRVIQDYFDTWVKK